MEITYTRVGDYYLPNLAAPESPKVGRWGMLRFSYLRNHQEALYTTMLMKGTLNPHLEEVDRQAQEMEQRLISQLAQQEGITEQMKAENQLEWVARMNSIRKRAEQIVLNELIYSEKVNGSACTEDILSPLIVHSDEYEVISGHRRLYASQNAGLSQVPALVYEISREEAAIMLVDSNLHREHILPSERAFAYKLKLGALKH